MAGTATVTIGNKTWTCSLVSSYVELVQGLSGLESMPANQGMLFDFGGERIADINAYEMLFDLDVIFINDELKVTEVIHGFIIGDDFTTTVPCRYFLEVNAGEADGTTPVQPGDSVTISGSGNENESASIDLGAILMLMIVAPMMGMMMKLAK